MDANVKRMRLRYPGTCSVCDASINKGEWGLYDRAAKTVSCPSHDSTVEVPLPAPPLPAAPEMIELTRKTSCATCDIPLARGATVVRTGSVIQCVSCGGVDENIDVGTAGGSARTEQARRRAKRAADVRSGHKLLGGAILAVAPDDTQSSKWGTGAVGEERLGAGLERTAAQVGGHVLHDRSIPGSSANLDHIVVVPAGVFAVDAKRWSGRIDVRDVGGWFRTEWRVYVGGRNRTNVIASGDRQAARVNAALRAANIHASIVCRAAMCFVEGEWPLFGASDHRIDGVHVCPPRTLYKHLQAAGTLDAAQCLRVTQVLAAAFPAKKM